MKKLAGIVLIAVGIVLGLSLLLIVADAAMTDETLAKAGTGFTEHISGANVVTYAGMVNFSKAVLEGAGTCVMVLMTLIALGILLLVVSVLPIVIGVEMIRHKRLAHGGCA